MRLTVNAIRRTRIAKFWKPLEIIAGVGALIVWFTSMFLWMYYDHTRPTVADPSTGRIYPLNSHGSIVYLTQPEQFWLYSLIWVAGICFVIAVCIDVFKKPFRRRYE